MALHRRYQHFIQDCYERNVTQARPGNNTEKELNRWFQSAAARCGVEDDADFQRLRVRRTSVYRRAPRPINIYPIHIYPPRAAHGGGRPSSAAPPA